MFQVILVIKSMLRKIMDIFFGTGTQYGFYSFSQVASIYSDYSQHQVKQVDLLTAHQQAPRDSPARCPFRDMLQEPKLNHTLTPSDRQV